MTDDKKQPPLAIARPTLYIDIDMGGRKQALPVPVAQALYDELGLALASLNPPLSDQTKSKKP